MVDYPPLHHSNPAMVEMAHEDRLNKLDALDEFLREQLDKHNSSHVADEVVQLYQEVALRETDPFFWLGCFPAGGVERFATDLKRKFTDGDQFRLVTIGNTPHPGNNQPE